MQHDPAGELLVHRLLGVARQADGIRGLDEVRRHVPLRNSPGTTGKKYALLASVKSTVPTRPRYSSNTMPELERTARLALAEEGAVQVAVISLRDLGMGDQVIEEIRAAHGVDVLIRLGAELVLDLAPDVVALLLDAGRRAGVVKVQSISVCAVTPNSVNRS